MYPKRSIAVTLGFLFFVSTPLMAENKPLSRDELLLLVDMGLDSSAIIEAVESRCVSFTSLSTDDALKLSEYASGILAAIKDCQSNTSVHAAPAATESVRPGDQGEGVTEAKSEGITTGTWQIMLCNDAAPVEWRQSQYGGLRPVGGWEAGTIDISDTTVTLHVPKRTFPKVTERNIVFNRHDIISAKVTGVPNRGKCITTVEYRNPNAGVNTVSFSGRFIGSNEWLGPNVTGECEASVALHSLLIGKAIEAPFEDKPAGTESQEAIVRGFWLDPNTGLTWTVNDSGVGIGMRGNGDAHKRFSQAEKYCQKLSLGGHSDWRLPTIDELENLSDPGNRRNTFDEYDDDTVGIKDPIRLHYGRIWSRTIATPGGSFSRTAWIYDFRTNSREENGTIEHFNMCVLCVR